MRRNIGVFVLMGLALALPAWAAGEAETQPAADIEALRADLRSGDEAKEMAAANALAGMGEKAAPAAADLVKLLEGPSVEAQSMMHMRLQSPSLSATAALLRIGPGAVDALADGLKSEKADLRLNAVYVLTAMGAEKNFAVLAPAAKDASPAVRALLIRSLARVSTREAVALRLSALTDSEAEVRFTAVVGFGELNPAPDLRHPVPEAGRPDVFTLSAVLKALTPVLQKDPEARIRAGAATSMGLLRESNGWTPLTTALGDSEPEVRAAAAGALGKLADRRAVPALLQSLQDKDESVVVSTEAALGAIGDPLATRALIPLLIYDVLPKTRYMTQPGTAAHALGQIGDRRAVPALIAALDGPSDFVSSQVAEALGNIGDPRAADALLAVLKRKPVEQVLLMATATALGKLREPRAIEPLVDLLMDNKVSPVLLQTALKNIAHPRVVVVLADRAVSDTSRNLAAVALLSDLTGRNLRFDNAGLKKWWAANRQQYVDAAAEVATRPAATRPATP